VSGYDVLAGTVSFMYDDLFGAGKEGMYVAMVPRMNHDLASCFGLYYGSGNARRRLYSPTTGCLIIRKTSSAAAADTWRVVAASERSQQKILLNVVRAIIIFERQNQIMKTLCLLTVLDSKRP
jgi:hypothetical protein